MHRSLAAAKEQLKKGKSQDAGGRNYEQTWQKVNDQEILCNNSSPTGDEEFDRVGYKIVRNICPVELLVTDVPDVRGQLNYNTSDPAKYDYTPDEAQVPDSVARYTHPFYRKAFSLVKKNIEKSIGQSLYKTYYYDRFYFPGQDLKYHNDRDSCEISVTIHCSSNLKDKWPICIKAVDGSVTEADLKPGDGLIYKGCERPHWRLPMPGVRRNKIRKFFNMEEYYYHQIFFHYVLANGTRSEFAGDKGKFNWS